ncbi:uncharacterized protein A1O9_07127 [Exophiala aquamarina CBS 119918]|uniref:Uncharacterized protein n=1 Tax=Exophiala aquamarina CBS 119918 TaxID=1182545 RepID=A0A072PAZ8_9EURO|nr:uncharacterized protein A1O9_07127 [Exophiala aquamarina CBS 119918]KEF56937.1 hypothetical protein A1O9_07127 [Exophiala aquamarina CBS 119918]
MKWQYADTFYTEEEFWAIYDREGYQKLRRKYGAESLPDVYQKVRTIVADKGKILTVPARITGVLTGDTSLQNLWEIIWSVWPLVGVKAVLSALMGVEYLRKND